MEERQGINSQSESGPITYEENRINIQENLREDTEIPPSYEDDTQMFRTTEINPPSMNTTYERVGPFTIAETQSVNSLDILAPSPSTAKEKTKFTIKYLTLSLSNTYAVLIVTMGIIIYSVNHFFDASPGPIFSLLLFVVGFIYQVFLIIDIAVFKYTQSKALRNKKETPEQRMYHESGTPRLLQGEGDDMGYRNDSDKHSECMLSQEAQIMARKGYYYVHEVYFGSSYLKLGAAAFAFGHLIHSLLLIAVQFQYYTDDNYDNESCVNKVQMFLDIFSTIYCFLQLFFIFNYSNIIILRKKRLAQFGFMHMIGSSLCFWLSTIYRETFLALAIYQYSSYNKTNTFITDVPDVQAVNHVGSFKTFDIKCRGPPSVSTIFENFSPYLLPFSVEFHLLVVAFYYNTWSNIDSHRSDIIPLVSHDHKMSSQSLNVNEARRHMQVNCQDTTKGWFFSFIFMVVVVANLIIGYVLSSVGGEKTAKSGYVVNDITKLAMHTLMVITVLIAYNKIRKLDINEHHTSLLDDVLLYICLPFFIAETILTLIATFFVVNVVKSLDVVVMMIQVIIQTSFLCDGLRRCSNSRRLRKTRPGRQVILVLLVCNVGLWLVNTFSYKSPYSLDERYEFYGKVLWTCLGHVTLPLIMFYRFHSSVCLAEIWDAAYKPGISH